MPTFQIYYSFSPFETIGPYLLQRDAENFGVRFSYPSRLPQLLKLPTFFYHVPSTAQFKRGPPADNNECAGIFPRTPIENVRRPLAE